MEGLRIRGKNKVTLLGVQMSKVKEMIENNYDFNIDIPISEDGTKTINLSQKIQYPLDPTEPIYKSKQGLYYLLFFTSGNIEEICSCEWCKINYQFSKNIGEPVRKNIEIINRKKYIIYTVDGTYCSPECLLADTKYRNNINLLRDVKLMLEDCYPDIEINPAPSRRQLKIHGGVLNHDEFKERKESDFYQPRASLCQSRTIFQVK